MRVQWSHTASGDLRRLHAFLKESDPYAALRALRTIRKSTHNLLLFPNMGTPLPENRDYRELYVSFGQNGYVVRYRLSVDEVFITRVWHSREKREN